MILSGHTYAIPFLTRNAAGFLSDPATLPTGSIWASGALSDSSVTITKSSTSQYLASGTLPGMVDGDVCVVRAHYTTDVAHVEPIMVDTVLDAISRTVAPTLTGIPFEVRNAARALVAPDALPTVKLLVNGVDSSATVTVANVTTGRYTASVVTMPSISAGDYIVLRALWDVAGLSGGIDCYWGFYWTTVAPTSEPVSRFDDRFSDLCWPHMAFLHAVDGTYTTTLGIQYAVKVIRRKNREDNILRQVSLNDEWQCTWQIDLARYPLVVPEKNAVITVGTKVWVVTGYQIRGTIIDFTCRHLDVVELGSSNSVLVSAKATGEW